MNSDSPGVGDDHDGLVTMSDINETAEEIQERHGVDYDSPESVVIEEVTRDTDLSTAIREYPPDEDADYDVPNQIKWDLKGTYRWRAVALHDENGRAVEWYACENGQIRQFWPEHFDVPVWKRWSVYAFINSWDGESKYTLALHPWPVDMDPDAEVVG